jgi:hypothetical protein
MMELMDDLLVRCDECGGIIRICRDDIDFEISSYDHGENGMGDETEYYCGFSAICGNCGSEIDIRISGYEYPAGAFNYESSEIDGGEFLEMPHMAVVYCEEDFDLEYAYDEYDRIDWLIRDLAKNNELIYEITSREFEEVVERLFQNEGFETVLTPAVRDGGKDIIATKMVLGKPVVFYVECKQYGKQNDVGVNIVRSLYGVQTKDRINKSILVTTGHVTRGTRKFVDDSNTLMSVIDANEIFDMIQRSAERQW